MNEQFTDWLIDEDYSTSYYPSTELRELSEKYEEETGEKLKLSEVKRLIEKAGYKVEGNKVFIWQPSPINKTKTIVLPDEKVESVKEEEKVKEEEDKEV